MGRPKANKEDQGNESLDLTSKSESVESPNEAPKKAKLKDAREYVATVRILGLYEFGQPIKVMHTDKLEGWLKRSIIKEAE